MIVATQSVGYREHLCVGSHCNLNPESKNTDPQTQRLKLNPKTQREQQALTTWLADATDPTQTPNSEFRA